MDIGKGKTAHSSPFKSGVGIYTPEQLQEKLSEAMDDLRNKFPGLGIALWVYDFGGGGGLGYIGNGDTEGVIRMVLEWCRKKLGK